MSKLDSTISEEKQAMYDAADFFMIRIFAIIFGCFGVACTILIKGSTEHLPPIMADLYGTLATLGCLTLLWQFWHIWNWYWKYQQEERNS